MKKEDREKTQVMVLGPFPSRAGNNQEFTLLKDLPAGLDDIKIDPGRRRDPFVVLAVPNRRKGTFIEEPGLGGRPNLFPGKGVDRDLSPGWNATDLHHVVDRELSIERIGPNLGHAGRRGGRGQSGRNGRGPGRGPS